MLGVFPLPTVFSREISSSTTDPGHLYVVVNNNLNTWPEKYIRGLKDTSNNSYVQRVVGISAEVLMADGSRSLGATASLKLVPQIEEGGSTRLLSQLRLNVPSEMSKYDTGNNDHVFSFPDRVGVVFEDLTNISGQPIIQAHVWVRHEQV